MQIAADRTFRLYGDALCVEPIDGSRGRRAYAAFLRIVIRVNRKKRKLFGGTVPEWATNATSVFGHLNLLGVIPTFLAILLVPKHFFEHVSQRGGRATLLSVPPVRLILQSAAIVVLCFAPVEIKMNSLMMPLGMAAIALTSPIWLGFAVWVVYCVGLFCRSEHLRVGAIPYLLIRSCGYLLPVEQAYECLHTIFNWKIDRSRLLWGCCYLSLVSLFTMAVWCAALTCIIFGLSFLLAPIGADGDFFSQLLGWMLAAILFLGLAVAARRFVDIYSRMIASATICPTKKYYTTNEKRLFDFVKLNSEGVFGFNVSESRGIVDLDVKRASSMVLKAVIVETRLRKFPNRLRTYLDERASILSLWPPTEFFKQSEESRNIAQCLAELRLSEPVSRSATLTPQLMDKMLHLAKQ